MAIQDKSIRNFNAASTNQFEPELLAEFIARNLSKYGDDPSITFMIFMNADALIDQVELHEFLKQKLSVGYPIWLYGLEDCPDREGSNWFIRYIYPGLNAKGRCQYEIPPPSLVFDREAFAYEEYLSSLL